MWVINAGNALKKACMEYELKDSIVTPPFLKKQKLRYIYIFFFWVQSYDILPSN